MFVPYSRWRLGVDEKGPVARSRFGVVVRIARGRQLLSTYASELRAWRRHREDVASRHTVGVKVDPYSSGLSFDGWIGRPRFRPPADYVPLPVSPAQTDLLRFEWKRHGLVDLFERPGPVELFRQRW